MNLRSRLGRVLTIAVAGVAGTVLIAAAQVGPEAVARAIAPCALLVFATWAAYWRPFVRIEGDLVTVGNVFSTDRVRLEQIQRIDTRYALTLETTQGKITAWAAPAPGRHSAMFARRDEAVNLPESTYLAGTVRPGDLTTSDSGAAAAEIRRRWEDLRDARGSIGDGPAVPRDRSIHWATIVVTVALLGASILSIAL